MQKFARALRAPLLSYIIHVGPPPPSPPPLAEFLDSPLMMVWDKDELALRTRWYTEKFTIKIRTVCDYLVSAWVMASAEYNVDLCSFSHVENVKALFAENC